MIKIEENIYEIEINDIKKLFQERPSWSNKGIFGIVGIMGGCIEYTGAIKLSNMSASTIRGGCGIVRVIIPESLASTVAPYLLEQTLYPLKYNDGKLDNKELEKSINNLKALAVGMG